jgi:hypothetical protein
MRPGDGMCDLRQRWKGFSGVFEAVLHHDHRVRPAAPLPYQPRARPEGRIGRDDDAPLDLQFLGQRLELSLGRLAQPAVGKLLHAIGSGADQQVPAQSRRLASIQPTPLVAQLLGGQFI